VRRLLCAVLAAAVAACTAAAPATVVAATAAGPRLETPMQPMTVGQAAHSAFPSLARETGGKLLLTWRQASSHLATNGMVMTAESYDDGATWGNTQTVKVNLYRDPSTSSIGGINYMTWFGANSTNPAMGVAVQREWWEFSRRIDTLQQAAISGPVTQLPDGRMGVAFYGKQAGEAVWTAWMGWSSDGAWSWTTNRVVNFLGAGMSTAEPYLVVNGVWTHMLFRWGDNAIGIRSSPDSGVSWPEQPRKILDNATGRPTVIASGDTLLTVYREASTGNAVMATSVDNGGTWVPGGTVLAAPAGGMMTYASMVPSLADPKQVRVVVGMEQAGGATSQLWNGTVVLP